MIIGKRHLVLAGLLIALGAAVYLNWQFAPTDTVMDTGSLSQTALTDEGYIAVSTNTLSDTDASAQPMNEDAVDAAVTKDTFASSREERSSVRQEALDTVNDILSDPSLDDDAKAAAASTAAKISENMEKEASIELLIKAKGYRDCVVIISESQVNVVVPAPAEGLKSSDAAIIRDIVVGQLNISPGSIKIIEAK